MEAEKEHWCDVLRAFREYSHFMAGELHRRESHAAQLPAKYKSMLPSGTLEFKAEGMRQALKINQTFLNLIATDQESSGFQGEEVPDDGYAAAKPSPPGSRPSTSPAHFSKVKSTLHQVVRDWSEEGAAERQACYGPLVEELSKRLPVTESNANLQRVLVPGCGLGRLAFDLACMGYAAQGSEFSYFMLFASNYILNGGWESPNCAAIHPFIHEASNHLRPQDMLRPVSFPDVPPSRLLDINPRADFSMVAGEFCEVYGSPEQRGQWDAIVTCFFLDTAPVLFEYLETLWSALRPGGLWINLGPLLYHWQHTDVEEVGPKSQPPSDGGWGTSPSPAQAESSLSHVEPSRAVHSHSHAHEGPGGEHAHSHHHGPTVDAHGIDSRYHRSVELCYSEVRHAIQAFGFSLLHEARAPSTHYASNRLSLMKVVYQPLLFTVQKPLE